MSCGKLAVGIGDVFTHSFTHTEEANAAVRAISGDTHERHITSNLAYGPIVWLHVGAALTKLFGSNYFAREHTGEFPFPLFPNHEILIILVVKEVRTDASMLISCSAVYFERPDRCVLKGTVVMRPV